MHFRGWLIAIHVVPVCPFVLFVTSLRRRVLFPTAGPAMSEVGQGTTLPVENMNFAKHACDKLFYTINNMIRRDEEQDRVTLPISSCQQIHEDRHFGSLGDYSCDYCCRYAFAVLSRLLSKGEARLAVRN